MAKEYASRRAGLALATGLAGMLGYGCSHLELQESPITPVPAVSPTATPVCLDYDSAKAHLLRTLNPNVRNISRPLYDSVERSGSTLPDGKKSRSFMFNDHYIVVSTQKRPVQLEVKVLPLPGKTSFEVETVPFTKISFTNYDVSKDTFDNAEFELINPCTGKKFPTIQRQVDMSKISQEDKLFATTLGRHILYASQRPQATPVPTRRP